MARTEVKVVCSRCGKSLDLELLLDENVSEGDIIACANCEAPFDVVTEEETRRIRVETAGELRRVMFEGRKVGEGGAWH